MARKVFLSVLGTSFYSKCIYKYGNKESSETRFVQKALLEINGVKDWAETDAICVLLTSAARENNWLVCNNRRRLSSSPCEEEYVGLKDEIAGMSLKAEVHEIDIADGYSEEEIWDIFSAAFDFLQEGDELYVDLTHGFRSIPMLILVLANYAKFLKGVEIKSISYGNFEARNKEINVVPIIDLLPLVRLQEWTTAAAEFTKSGITDTLTKLGQDAVKPFLKNTGGKDSVAQEIKSFVKKLPPFVDEIHFCRGLKIFSSESYKDILKSYELLSCLPNTRIKPLTPIIGKVMSSMQGFVAFESSVNMFAAAKWSLLKENYQASGTLLYEGIITALCERAGYSILPESYNSCTPFSYDKVRSCARRALLKVSKDKKYEPSSPEDESLIDSFLLAKGNSVLINDEEFVLKYSELNELRNDFNHSGMRANARKINTLKEQLPSLVNYFFDFFSKPAQRIFINFSSHPSSKWGESQIKAALEYGTVEDLQFPVVDPDKTSDELKSLAEQYVGKIMDLADKHETTVHIMGEMNLCFIIVGSLLNKGIRCVASTTTRNVIDNPDGTNTASFEFKAFREYVR